MEEAARKRTCSYDHSSYWDWASVITADFVESAQIATSSKEEALKKEHHKEFWKTLKRWVGGYEVLDYTEKHVTFVVSNRYGWDAYKVVDKFRKDGKKKIFNYAFFLEHALKERVEPYRLLRERAAIITADFNESARTVTSDSDEPQNKRQQQFWDMLEKWKIKYEVLDYAEAYVTFAVSLKNKPDAYKVLKKFLYDDEKKIFSCFSSYTDATNPAKVVGSMMCRPFSRKRREVAETLKRLRN